MKRIALAVALAAFLAPSAHAATHHHARPALIPMATIEGYASVIAGQTVTISCEPGAAMLDRDGYVTGGSSVIHLTRSTCKRVEAVRRQERYPTGAFFTYGDARADIRAGAALAVIEHEAMHIALRSGDEGLVDCTAYQNRWSFVRLFGFPSWIARMELAGMAWHHSQMPPAYRTDC